MPGHNQINPEQIRPLNLSHSLPVILKFVFKVVIAHLATSAILRSEQNLAEFVELYIWKSSKTGFACQKKSFFLADVCDVTEWANALPCQVNIKCLPNNFCWFRQRLSLSYALVDVLKQWSVDYSALSLSISKLVDGAKANSSLKISSIQLNWYFCTQLNGPISPCLSSRHWI